MKDGIPTRVRLVGVLTLGETRWSVHRQSKGRRMSSLDRDLDQFHEDRRTRGRSLDDDGGGNVVVAVVHSVFVIVQSGPRRTINVLREPI